MKVLHLWNTAGVGSIIAKFVDKAYGTEGTVMTRRKFDQVGFTTYGKAYDDGATRFFVRAMLAARKADLVHVTSWDRAVPWLKRLYPGKPVALYYVGTDILGRWGEKHPRWKKADAVAYSTSNLASGAPQDAIHIPAPIDTEFFSRRDVVRNQGTALSRHYGMDAEAEGIAKDRGLRLEWIGKLGVPHADLPELFSSFEYYIDLRRPEGHQEPVHSVGKAALEALACGCKVIPWSGEVISTLPDENRPETVAATWHALYERLLTGSKATK